MLLEDLVNEDWKGGHQRVKPPRKKRSKSVLVGLNSGSFEIWRLLQINSDKLPCQSERRINVHLNFKKNGTTFTMALVRLSLW
jgi:hypothetical protein